jgi:hypothetical protein
LEGALGGAVALGVGADRVTEHAIAGLEAGDGAADLDDLAGGVGAEHEGILDPAEQEVARDLLDPVDRVHRHGVVADDDLVGPRRRVRGRADLERALFGGQPGGRIGGRVSHDPDMATAVRTSYAGSSA